MFACAAFAGGPSAGKDAGSLEREGEALFRRAQTSYRKAVESWAVVERLALGNGDRWTLDRSRTQQARLAMTVRDSGAFRTVASRLGTAAALEPLALVLPESETRPPEEIDKDLSRIADFFTRAGRQYYRSADQEPRDLPLVFESLALAHRAVGDAWQRAADARFERALELVAPRSGDDPEATLAAGRLRFKLRRFDAATATLDPLERGGAGLSREQEISRLEMLKDLARYRRDEPTGLALQRRLIALGAKAEDQPPPRARFSSFVRGGSQILAEVAGRLLSWSSSFRLDPRERALTGYLAGLATLEAGRPGLAAEILRRVGPEMCGEPWLSAQVAARIGAAQQALGDYEAALAAYANAVRLVDGLAGADDFTARLGLNMAGVLLRLGDLDAARARAAAVLATPALKPQWAVQARLLLGDVKYFTVAADETGERRLIDDALEVYAFARRELEKARLPEALAAELETETDIRAGNSYRRLARLVVGDSERRELRARALAAAIAALEAARTHELTPQALVAAGNLAELRLEAGDLDEAATLAEWSLARSRQAREFEGEWRAHWYLGRVAAARKDPVRADQEFQEAAHIVESYRARILDSRRKAGYMSTKQTFFQSLVAHYLERGNEASALAAAERSRSRAFIESLGLRFLLFAADEDRTLYRQYVELLGRAEAARREPGAVLGVQGSVEASYEELREEIDRLREKIRTHPRVSPAVRSLVAGDAADLAAIQRELGEDAVLLEYFTTGDRLVAFLVSRTELRTVPLAVSPRSVARQVDAFVDGGAADPGLAARLYTELWQPLEPDLAALSRPLPGAVSVPSGRAVVPKVIAVPWGALHRLPLECLRGPRGYLVEEWDLSYLPSATLLKFLPGRISDKPRELVALVDPDTDYDGDGESDYPKLPHAQRELEGIAPLFEKRIILTGPHAAEAACVENVRSGDVLHFACHGQFFPLRPLDSSLYLSKGAGADGRLRAVEILGLDLGRSQLVTLSGCETGRFDVGPSDDPVGIGVAFLHSGARALLVSLWKVEDAATSALMQRFYRNWLGDKDRDRARALREAKVAMLREGRYAHPRQWGAFILIGNR